MAQHDGSRGMYYGKGFSPSTMWIMGIKLWSSALTINTYPQSHLTGFKVVPSRGLLVSIAAIIYLDYQAEDRTRSPLHSG